MALLFSSRSKWNKNSSQWQFQYSCNPILFLKYIRHFVEMEFRYILLLVRFRCDSKFWGNNFQVDCTKFMAMLWLSLESTKMCELSEFKMLNYFVSINSQSYNIKAFDQKLFIDKQQSATTHQKNQAKWSEIATINRSWFSSSCLYLMGTWHIHTKTDSS